MKVNIGISNKHVHLTEEVYNLLFDEEISVKVHLKQGGEFASNSTLTLVGPKGSLERVRVLGPFRSYSQAEISKKDARDLGINPPVRQSGELDDAATVILKTEKAEVEIKGAIIAGRHVHVNSSDCEKLDLYNGDKVFLRIEGDKSGVIDAVVKVNDTAFFEAHLDTDDAAAFLLDNDSVLELEKC